MAGAYQSEEEMKKAQGGYLQEPAVGIPYGYPVAGAPGQPSATQPPQQQQALQYAYVPETLPHHPGMVPANAIYGPPNGIPLRETYFADTPAPFECSHCGKPGMTEVKSSPSLAACVACMVSLVGFCFLCKGCDCLWHKAHYCPNCGEKVADFKKSDPCLVMDLNQWQQVSYALPA